MKEYQTSVPKERSRFSEISGRRSRESQSRKQQKIVKKSLSPDFSAVSEGVFPQITDEPIDFSSVSEISDSNYTGDLTESFVLSSDQVLLALLETSTVSDLTPRPKISSIIEDEQISSSKVGSAEVEIVAKLLGQENPNSVDLDCQSRKIVDALTKAVLHEIYDKPEEQDLVIDVVSLRRNAVLVCFFTWILVVLIILLFSADGFDTFHGRVPT
ncbi:hypothetical protein SLEP1_g45876 [Rubroshorea leprosula]|uniref:Uncharacterized protein n=1 Tax=Rubroshorea leprosula TaxID=152421 RepID=A0AAV5LKF4_9ROSI|nr:hypothetical protein SLEP1_g45876 [Rubroshorea leprosula]